MTIAQQLKINKFPFKIFDSNGNEIYYEESDGYWNKCEFDSNGNMIYFENSNGYWCKYIFNSECKKIRSEDSWGDIEYFKTLKEEKLEALQNTIEQANEYGYISWDSILDICDENMKLVKFVDKELIKMIKSGEVKFEYIG
jgi:hypothetical protein